VIKCLKQGANGHPIISCFITIQNIYLSGVGLPRLYWKMPLNECLCFICKTVLLVIVIGLWHSRESLMRGWELLSVCLSFFPPSFRFLTCLDGYISRSLDHAAEQVTFCSLSFSCLVI